MKENTNNYSDEWQPYTGDYDKFEYDIKLEDGTIVENCYPNGGKFNSISDEHDAQSFDESLIKEIRFSQSPRYGLLNIYSTAEIDIEYHKRQVETEMNIREEKALPYMMHSFIGANSFNDLIYTTTQTINSNTSFRKKSELGSGYRIDLNTYEKIGRNVICPKCDSGLKYKKCCGR
jgi:hypothetical protein